MSIRPGQRVRCVDSGSHVRYTPNCFAYLDRDMHGLTEGEIYTVAAIIDWHGVIELVLAEIDRPLPEGMTTHNPGFAAARFRRLLEVSDFMPERERAPA